jgi:toxin-antitoxin system PIN domain toxin
VNLWVALTFSSHPHQAIARQVFNAATNSAPACFCRVTQQNYLRLLTSEKLWHVYGSSRISNQRALTLFSTLVSEPEVIYLAEPEAIQTAWYRLAVLEKNAASPKVWMDAYLAAFAISANISLATIDQDFVKYRRYGLDLRLLKT